MKKIKVGPLINYGDLKLPNGRYSTNHKKCSKILVYSDRTRGPKLHKNDFSDKNDGFPAPIIWKELFNPKKIIYYLSIYLHIR